MPEASGEPKDGVPTNAQEGILSFPKNCRAKLIGVSTLVLECLVPPPQNCGCILRYGNTYFCLHASRWEIAARTLALEKRSP
jgi:hypothetical protein